jgi:hypothetical protein
MKTVLGLIVVVSLLSFPLMAEDYPKAEIYGGYQYMRLTNIINSGVNFNGNGWTASLTGNFNRMFGVVGDFGGGYNTISGVSTKVYTYTGGPVVALNSAGTINPFVHALFGGAHFNATAPGGGSGSSNGFTMMYGGGVDVKMSKMLALRGQVDWVYFHLSGVSLSNNVRISTGIVLRF